MELSRTLSDKSPGFSTLVRLSSTMLLSAAALVTLQANAAEVVAASTMVVDTPAAPPEASGENEESDLSKVVVRARNRLEPLKDVPLSISVVTGKELERLDATDIKSVLQRAGNVAWNQGNQRTSSLSIRGIGKIGQTEAQDPSVVVNVDGVNYAYNALTSSYDFVDVDTIEVTRGPQGTLQGKSATIGTISINTRRPSFKSEADYGITFGQRNYLQAWAAGGGAVVDDLLAWRGTVSFTKSRGDIVNLYNQDDTYTNEDRATGRVQFLLTPSEDLSARLIVERSPDSPETTNGRTIRTPTPTTYDNGATNATTNEVRLNRRWFMQQTSFSVASTYLYGGGQNAVDYATQRGVVTGSNGATLQVDWHIGLGDITSISAYRDYHFNAVNDTGVPFDVTRNNGGFNNDYKQWSQELRFSSTIAEIADYQGGLFFMRVLNNALYQKVFGDDAGAWYASNAQYATLDADGSGRDLLRNSLAGLSVAYNSPTGLQKIENTSKAVFFQANWHLSTPLTITTGVRFTREDRQNQGSSFIRDNGSGAELNPASVNGISLGGFTSTSTGTVYNGQIGNGTSANIGYLNTTDPAQIALANALAQKYFGVSTYAALTGQQAAQVAVAKSIRAGQIGTVFNATNAQPFKATQPSFVFSPTYKINDNITAFAAWQYGEKAGIAQFLNASSSLVKAEKNNDFELGIKSVLLDHKLTFNANLFLMNIKDYQQSLSVLDSNATANTGVPTYVTTTGNVPKVQAKGLEIDSVYVGLPFTTIRFSGAYNDARYKKFPNSPQPVENGNLTGAAASNDVSGQQLAGAAKWTGNLGVDYRVPVSEKFEFHVSTNAAYTSRFNSDASLSRYAWIDASTIVDAGVGVGRRDQRFDVTFLVKNVFNDDTPLSQTWNSYTPATPRWWYLQFTGKL